MPDTSVRSDQLASEILARATTAIRGLDLTRVNWIAATILKNVETPATCCVRTIAKPVARACRTRSMRSARRNFRGRRPGLEPGKLLAELTRLIGVDADLVLRVIIDGYTQAEAGQQWAFPKWLHASGSSAH